jgi:UDP-N-acetylglucosamine 2-epimerase (non-hydrolysing)
VTHDPVVVVVGTRPEAIKLAPVVLALQARPSISTVVVTTGQHRQLVADVLELFGITADHDLSVADAGPALSSVAAATIDRCGALLERVRPRAVIVQGDTLSAYAAGVAAFYQHIPVAHVEAGLRSDDVSAPFPEEFHRRSTALLADVHLAPTRTAGARLLAEGVAAERVHVTGNTVVDALRSVLAVRRSRGLTPLSWRPELAQLAERSTRLLVVTAHRRESWGSALGNIAHAVERIAKAEPDVAIAVCTHPNPLVAGEFARLGELDNVILTPAVGYADFVDLMDRADLILTDSGGIQEEAPSLGTPVLVLRDRTERMEGVHAGVARLVGTSTENIVSEVQRLLDDPLELASMSTVRDLHGDGQAAGRCVDILIDLLDHPAP